ncbi:hypothetical protein [Sanguibacter sp. HDW7]|uniref:hypothetical protein n=1 Tax=Sanguibacter sp. HDW7 TaxID=2714931 RepID=UPI0014090600|nr:hypothetical protein [Sanguibacter sp. HDW7]QIK83080.1 hypothetical protein G7063_05145 [Sanguibacter sp. HDW7]
MATGRASAQDRRTGRTRTRHGRAAAPEQQGRVTFPQEAPVVDAPVGTPDEPTDDELDARSREILEGLPALEDLLAERMPLALVADLLSPFGPDSQRISREEKGL